MDSELFPFLEQKAHRAAEGGADLTGLSAEDAQEALTRFIDTYKSAYRHYVINLTEGGIDPDAAYLTRRGSADPRTGESLADYREQLATLENLLEGMIPGVRKWLEAPAQMGVHELRWSLHHLGDPDVPKSRAESWWGPYTTALSTEMEEDWK